ncbi:recombinase family protein [Monashia sp. NPDC004114]
MSHPARAALYLRLSVSKDDSTSLTVQEKDLRARAAAEGWEVTHVIREDGLSGAKNAESTARALDLIRRGHADVLLVWKFDRWSRAGIPALGELVRTLREVPSARFVALKDAIDSAMPFWEVIAAVLATIAEQERENVRARVRASIAERVSVGRYTGGTVAYGYTSAPHPSGVGRTLVLDDEEAPMVREAAERVLSGESVYTVVRDFNDRAIPTRRPVRKSGPRAGQRTTWTVQALAQILTSDAALGRVTHSGRLVRDQQTGEPLQAWPALLEVEDVHRLRARLQYAEKKVRADGKRTRRARSSRLLAGLATCGACGMPLYARSNGQGTVSYGCSARSNGRPCPGVSVSAERLEEHVAERFLAQVGEHEIYERLEVTTEDVDLAEVERSIGQVKADMDDDDADLPALAAQLGALKARRAEIASRPARPTVRLVPTGETYAAAWARLSAAGDVDGLRSLLAPNLAVLSITKGRRGAHGLDPSRVVLISQPAHPKGARADEDARPGRLVVTAEGAA